MLLLLSTPLQIILLDTDTQQTTLLRTGDGYYYGITSKDGAVVLTHTGGYMQYFRDGKSFRTIDHLVQPHQVEWIDGYLLVANTGKNCISIFDERGNLCRDVYLNDIEWDDKDKGRSGNHFNSVHRVKDRVYVVAHNYERPSEVWELTWPELDVLGSKSGDAAWAHNIWLGEWGMVVCDSKNGSLYDLTFNSTIWHSGEENALSRGMAVSDEYIFVGYSMLNERKDRYWKTGGVWIIERKTLKTIDKIILPGSGDVHEIRLVGFLDDCHNGHLISLSDLNSLKKNSIFIDWAYRLRSKFPIFQQDMFPMSQLVRACQLTNRGRRHLQRKST